MDKCFSLKAPKLKKTLLKWFNHKFKQKFDKIDPFRNTRYENQHSINWGNDKCVINRFPIKLERTNYKTPDDQMSFGDFVIRFEHKFLRNIYTIEQIQDSDHLKNIEVTTQYLKNTSWFALAY